MTSPKPIDTEMEFLPSTLAAASVLDCCPLAHADDRWPSAVDNEVYRSARSNAIYLDIEVLGAARKGRVVGEFPLSASLARW